MKTQEKSRYKINFFRALPHIAYVKEDSSWFIGIAIRNKGYSLHGGDTLHRIHRKSPRLIYAIDNLHGSNFPLIQISFTVSCVLLLVATSVAETQKFARTFHGRTTVTRATGCIDDHELRLWEMTEVGMLVYPLACFVSTNYMIRAFKRAMVELIPLDGNRCNRKIYLSII